VSDLEIGDVTKRTPHVELSLSKCRFKNIVILYLCAGGPFGTASSDWVIDYHFDKSLDDSVNSLSGSQISFDVVRANNEANNKLIYSTQK
jgi:hypothetical protein